MYFILHIFYVNIYIPSPLSFCWHYVVLLVQYCPWGKEYGVTEGLFLARGQDLGNCRDTACPALVLVLQGVHLHQYHLH